MPSTLAHWGPVTAILATGCLIVGCPQPPDGGAGSDVSATSIQQAEAEFALSRTGADQLAQLLDGGASTQDALTTLADNLRQDPMIAAAALQDDNRGLWVFYKSGLEQVYWVVEEDDFGIDPQVAISAASPGAAKGPPTSHRLAPSANVAAARGPVTTIAQSGSTIQYKLPANNKAVLANALHVTIPLQDVRQPLEKMLTACGYEVTSVDADFEFFKNMSRFGVVFLEAHGGIRPSTAIPICQEPGTDAAISTSVPITAETEQMVMKEYFNDLYICGRLRRSTVEVKREGKPTLYFPFWAVTPAFVRKYDTGKFPDYALVCFSACRSFTPDGSQWADLTYEKSYGSVFVGWDNHVHYGISARAMLHLFQFLTGADEQFDLSQIDPKTGAKTIFPLLFKNDYAPVLPQSVDLAVDGLRPKNFDVDPKTTARLTAKGDSLYGFNRLILTPAIETFETLGDGKVRLGGRCADNAELWFGEETAVNIGSASNGVWEFPLAAHLYGPMSLHLQNRKSPPRDLLRWYPVVVRIRNAQPADQWGTCNSEATYRLSLRAIAAGHREGAEVWNKPETAFSGHWDPDASTVTWSVTGDKTVPDDFFGPSRCQWSGSGSRTFGEVSVEAGGTGEFYYPYPLDAKSAWLAVSPPFFLEGTMSCSGLSAPDYACGPPPGPNAQVPLRATDWSILSGSTTDVMGFCVIEWEWCTPTPAFDSTLAPR